MLPLVRSKVLIMPSTARLTALTPSSSFRSASSWSYVESGSFCGVLGVFGVFGLSASLGSLAVAEGDAQMSSVIESSAAESDMATVAWGIWRRFASQGL